MKGNQKRAFVEPGNTGRFAESASEAHHDQVPTAPRLASTQAAEVSLLLLRFWVDSLPEDRLFLSGMLLTTQRNTQIQHCGNTANNTRAHIINTEGCEKNPQYREVMGQGRCHHSNLVLQLHVFSLSKSSSGQGLSSLFFSRTKQYQKSPSLNFTGSILAATASSGSLSSSRRMIQDALLLVL